jgi:hypothetical protein
MPFGQLDRATVHPCSNCGKSPGSCGDETVAGMDGSIPELGHYIDTQKRRDGKINTMTMLLVSNGAMNCCKALNLLRTTEREQHPRLKITSCLW